MESFLTNSKIKYGGGSSTTQNALLFIQSQSPLIEFTEFSESGNIGIICNENANPDLGGGAKKSEGYNFFNGFSKNYAIQNNTKTDIYAMNNCWGTEDTLKIELMIYDKKDKSTNGKVFYTHYKNDCSPKPPNKVTLIEPSDQSLELDTNCQFKWHSSKGAADFHFFLSSNQYFDTTDLIKKILTDTVITIIGLKPKTEYHWKVNSTNVIGEGDFSEIFKFVTFDTTKPDPPKIIKPTEFSEDNLCTVEFEWLKSEKVSAYWLQISEDSLFQFLGYDNSSIIDTQVTVTFLKNYMTYYCRIAAKNRNGFGEWSDKFIISTSECPKAAPPKSWVYQKQTGENSLIILPQDINQDQIPSNLAEGDAVGVFYSRDGDLICGGYSIWRDNKNIAITAWGDNIQTLTKDGFDFKEKYRCKIWYSKHQIEIPVGVEYENDLPFFVSDTFSLVKSFIVLDSFKLKLKPQKWQLVSSPVAPYNSGFIQIFNSSDIAINNSKETIFYPVNNIYRLRDWNYLNCFEIFPFNETEGDRKSVV